MLNLILGLILFLPISVYSLDIGDRAPTLSDHPGAQHLDALKSLEGKVVFIDFWASWCPPCRKSLPWIARLQSRFPANKFQVITVNIDSNKRAGAALLSELQISVPVIHDPQGTLAEEFEVSAMPSSFLIDSKNKLVARFPGFAESDTGKVESMIDQLLNGEVSKPVMLIRDKR